MRLISIRMLLVEDGLAGFAGMLHVLMGYLIRRF